MAQTKKSSLVIVESPGKAQTIEHFLGRGYRVVASNGHIIDLPKSKLGVNEQTFDPEYIVVRGRAQILKTLKEEASEASRIYLATDPDREGEAISYHLANALNIPLSTKCRIEFNEITEGAIKDAIKNPRTVNMDRVDAQQARRVLDRLVGYKLSPLLWSKVKRGLSAGRVQSVAVRIIVEREDEIAAFKPREYWTVTAKFTKEGVSFEAKLAGHGGKKIEPASSEETDRILEDLRNADFTVKSVKTGKKVKKPAPPFTTSTLQQEASKKLGFTSKRTMMIAQGLYEGVKVSSTKTAGVITYMRTDSTRVSKDAQAAALAEIGEKYGEEYVPAKPNVYAAGKNAQDAHEAIRPTYIEYTPKKLKQYLTPDQFRLYSLIYNRFIASQMAGAEYDTLNAELDAKGYSFKSSLQKLTFNGYRAVYADSDDEENSVSLPVLAKGDICDLEELVPKQNFTAPPAHFTEASLIKTLEELGIGRPSTYVPIISTIIDRTYVQRSGKNLLPTDLGRVVNSIMEENFEDIVNVKFTAEMEEKLDGIEAGGEDWKKIVGDFYGPFSKELESARTEVSRVTLPDRPAGVKCEKCGAEMVIKSGRFGDFIACPNYPACKNTKPIVKTVNATCPKCGGKIVEKKSKKGSTFYGCENYPDCDFASWDLPVEGKCPVCGKYMVLKRFGRRSYKRCSDPDCPSNASKKDNGKK